VRYPKTGSKYSKRGNRYSITGTFYPITGTDFPKLVAVFGKQEVVFGKQVANFGVFLGFIGFSESYKRSCIAYLIVSSEAFSQINQVYQSSKSVVKFKYAIIYR
jgi:hypothetical protein